MNKALVAGGAGFIGSHLCERLLADGAAVLCVDDFSTGARGNVAHLLDHPRFDLLVQDVTEPFDAPADRIYDLACPAAPLHYRKEPVRTLRCSVYGAMNLLEIAARHGARFLLASTSEVYGDPEIHPQVESYWGHADPNGPRACYHEGKRAAEALALAFRRAHGVDARIARIFNTYGPRMRADDGRVVPTFVAQALAGEPLTVHGDGGQTRSFCYVDDLVEGLVRLMEHSGEVIGPVNLGNPEETSIRGLAGRILEMTGSAAGSAAGPGIPGEPRRRRPDIGLARRLVGWTPAVSLGDGLERTIADARTRSV